MLKTSWSIEAESSTTTTTSVWGLKYIPGRRTASSRSTTWPSRSASGVIASRLSPSRLRLLPQVLELAELTLDLGVHVQRLLAAALPAGVSRHDELPDLLAQLRVVRGRRGCL